MALDSLLERVCIVRVPLKVLPGTRASKKRKGAGADGTQQRKGAGADGTQQGGCKAAYFVLNDMVGAFPEEYLYIKTDEGV